MTIAPNFRLTKTLYTAIRHEWKELGPAAGKVAKTALAFFATPFALLLDSSVYIAHRFSQAKSLEAKIREKVERSNNHWAISDERFFIDALESAFAILGEEREALCKDLFRNDGEPPKGEAPFNIYQWGAATLLLHHLLNSEKNYFGYPRQYRENSPPKDKSMAQRHVKGVHTLEEAFSQLTQKEKVECIKAIWHPENPGKEPLKQFVTELNARASEMSADPQFVALCKWAKEFYKG
jgi:hypothetical protein